MIVLAVSAGLVGRVVSSKRAYGDGSIALGTVTDTPLSTLAPPPASLPSSGVTNTSVVRRPGTLYPTSTLPKKKRPPSAKFGSTTLPKKVNPGARGTVSTMTHIQLGVRPVVPTNRTIARSNNRTGRIFIPQRLRKILNGARVSPNDVRTLVKAGERGPAMPFRKGLGLGRFGGPPGPVPLAQAVATPADVSLQSGTLAKNGGLAMLLIMLVALPAEIFNSTLKEHHRTIASYHGRLRRAVDAAEARLEKLHPVAMLVMFAVAGSLLYGLADPTFGFDMSSLSEVTGFIGAILVITTVTQISRGIFMHRRYRKIGDLKAFPLGLAIAAVLVVFSRLSHFEPGYVFGVFAAIVFRVKPTEEEDGKSILLSSVGLVAVSVGCWFASIPIKDAVVAGNHSFAFLSLDSMLTTVWVCGLQSLLFGLIPMKYLDGEAIIHWSKVAWAGTYIAVMFIFVQMVVHPTPGGYGGNSNASFISMLYLFLGFMALSLLFWSYFRIRHGHHGGDLAVNSGMATVGHGGVGRVVGAMPGAGHWGSGWATSVAGSPDASPPGSPFPQQGQVAASSPAQWHYDPTGRHHMRFWSGWHWTEHVVAHDGGQGVDHLT